MWLTTHPQPALRIRMSEAIPPFFHMALWCANGKLSLYILAVLFMKLFLWLVVLNSKINPYYVSLPQIQKEDYIPECNLTLNAVQNFILPWDKSASQECAELS